MERTPIVTEANALPVPFALGMGATRELVDRLYSLRGAWRRIIVEDAKKIDLASHGACDSVAYWHALRARAIRADAELTELLAWVEDLRQKQEALATQPWTVEDILRSAG